MDEELSQVLEDIYSKAGESCKLPGSLEIGSVVRGKDLTHIHIHTHTC